MLQNQYIQSTQTINYSAAQLWSLLSSCVHVEKWHPLVDSSTLNGNKRICKTEQGILDETILVNDDENQTLKYLIHPQQIYPVQTAIICTMKVIDGKEGTIFMWDIEFEPTTDAIFTEMKDGVETLAMSFKNMVESL